jgi:hypothetical protein
MLDLANDKLITRKSVGNFGAVWPTNAMLAALVDLGITDAVPSLTPPALSSDLWFHVQATASLGKGTLKIWNGTNPHSNPANWRPFTYTDFIARVAAQANATLATAIANEIARAQGIEAGLRTDVNAATAAVAAAGTAATALTARVTTVETGLAAAQTNLTALSARVTATEAFGPRLTTAEADIAALEARTTRGLYAAGSQSVAAGMTTQFPTLTVSLNQTQSTITNGALAIAAADAGWWQVSAFLNNTGPATCIVYVNGSAVLSDGPDGNASASSSLFLSSGDTVTVYSANPGGSAVTSALALRMTRQP